MKTLRSLLLGILLCGGATQLVLAGAGWLTDFEAAKKTAAERNLPILMDFSGSDWCGWCIRLNKEVFATDVFKRFAEKNLVLFLADFPESKPQDPKEIAQNRILDEKYGVSGRVPTVLLVDAKGRVLATTGYQEGGADAYIKHLQALLASKAAK